MVESSELSQAQDWGQKSLGEVQPGICDSDYPIWVPQCPRPLQAAPLPAPSNELTAESGPALPAGRLFAKTKGTLTAQLSSPARGVRELELTADPTPALRPHHKAFATAGLRSRQRLGRDRRQHTPGAFSLRLTGYEGEVVL